MHNWILPQEFTAKQKEQFDQFSTELYQHESYSPKFTELLWRKGFRTSGEVEEFLHPNTDIVFNNYRGLYEIEKACELILEYVKTEQPIFIYGDYDVDGITSTSLLWRFLYRELGAKAIPFVPNRAKEGYGLNYNKLTEILSQTTAEKILLITVDCGARDKELVAKLKSEYPNLQVIITDHHQFPHNDNLDTPDLPSSADFVVHPLHPKSSLETPEICACAVAWNIVCCLRDLTGLAKSTSGLELVSLATVCDVMPLVKVNRAYVKLGLQEFKTSKIPGIQALCKVAGVAQKEVSTYHLGFVLGPRINAAGRIGEPLDAVRMFSTDKFKTADALSHSLNNLNLDRQKLTQDVLDDIATTVTVTDETKILFVAKTGWQEGVIGLIAGKLHEKYNLPTLVLTQKHDGNWVGSARSNKHIDVTKLISTQAELLVKFGGHGQAAGLTVSTSNLEALRAGLEAKAKELILPEHLNSEVTIDMELTEADLNMDFCKELELLEPYGYGNPEPKFLFKGLSFKRLRIFGQNNLHLCLYLEKSLNTEIVWFNHNLLKTVESELGTNPEFEFNLDSLTEKTDAIPPLTKEGLEQVLLGRRHDIIANLGLNQWKDNVTLQIKLRHHKFSK